MTLNADSAAAAILARGEVRWIIVGADRITANGDVANKIGTYPLAVLARYHQIPFFVAAPRSTFDLSMRSGGEIPIEQRAGREITASAGWPQDEIDPGSRDAGGAGAGSDVPDVFNPAFDVTPAELVTAMITDCGVIESPCEAAILASLGGDSAAI